MLSNQSQGQRPLPAKPVTLNEMPCLHTLHALTDQHTCNTSYPAQHSARGLEPSMHVCTAVHSGMQHLQPNRALNTQARAWTHICAHSSATLPLNQVASVPTPHEIAARTMLTWNNPVMMSPLVTAVHSRTRPLCTAIAWTCPTWSPHTHSTTHPLTHPHTQIPLHHTCSAETTHTHAYKVRVACTATC